MSTYYFVSYVWHRPGGQQNFCEAVLKDEHPVAWLIRAREINNQGEVVDMGILFWSEITEEQYNAWDGVVG